MKVLQFNLTFRQKYSKVVSACVWKEQKLLISKIMLNIIFQSLFLYLYLILTTEKYTNRKISISKKVLLTIFCLSISLISEFLNSHLSFIAYGICITSIVFIEKLILNYSNNEIVVSNLILYICISLIKISAYITNEIIYNTLIKSSNLSNKLITSVIFEYIYAFLLFGILINYILKNRENINKTIKELNFKDKILVIIFAVILITSTIIGFWLNDKIQNPVLLLFNIIKVYISSMLIFLSLKYIHCCTSSQEEISQQKLYIKTLSETNDNLRLLKHDYSNILQSINGYIVTKQYDELDKHINKLMANTKEISNLECISPKVINQPAIYGVIGAKYFRAKDKNVSFNIEVFADISSISFDFTKLSRILGILLDNAIEAAEKAENPYVCIKFSYNEFRKYHIIEIKNTFEKGKEIDTTKIFEKGESSKKNKSGLGLWEVKKILSSCKNASICASINNNNNFVQTLLAKN